MLLGRPGDSLFRDPHALIASLSRTDVVLTSHLLQASQGSGTRIIAKSVRRWDHISTGAVSAGASGAELVKGFAACLEEALSPATTYLPADDADAAFVAAHPAAAPAEGAATAGEVRARASLQLPPSPLAPGTVPVSVALPPRCGSRICLPIASPRSHTACRPIKCALAVLWARREAQAAFPTAILLRHCTRGFCGCGGWTPCVSESYASRLCGPLT